MKIKAIEIAGDVLSQEAGAVSFRDYVVEYSEDPKMEQNMVAKMHQGLSQSADEKLLATYLYAEQVWKASMKALEGENLHPKARNMYDKRVDLSSSAMTTLGGELTKRNITSELVDNVGRNVKAISAFF